MPENSLTRSYKGYKLLCEIRGGNNKSVCEEANDSLLATVIQNVYLDSPSSKPYAFRSNPPNLDGQIGVPSIVDRVLGKFLLKNFYHFSNWTIFTCILLLKCKISYSMLGEKTGGFFIESGAYDGEEISNSLFFELKRNYTGKYYHL